MMGLILSSRKNQHREDIQGLSSGAFHSIDIKEMRKKQTRRDIRQEEDHE